MTSPLAVIHARLCAALGEDPSKVTKLHIERRNFGLSTVVIERNLTLQELDALAAIEAPRPKYLAEPDAEHPAP